LSFQKVIFNYVDNLSWTIMNLKDRSRGISLIIPIGICNT